MKRKISVLILSMSLILPQTIPAFAENPGDAEIAVFSDEASIEVNEDASVFDETAEISTEAEDISQNNENDVSVFSEDEMPGESALTDYAEEEITGSNGDSLIQEDETVFSCEEMEEASMQTYAAGNSISSATGISIGTTYNGSITSTNTEDFYRFTISSSGKIKLTSTSLIPDVYYRIYDSTGERLWSGLYSANSSGQSSVNEEFDLTKGTYYLGVEKYYGTGSYSFKITFTSAGESFTETGNGNNNTIAEANSISIGTAYKGQIAKNDKYDFYKFIINSSGKITLTSIEMIPDVYYCIYDSMGERLWSGWYSANNSGQSSINEILDLTKGTYYLGVEKNYGTGNYSFKIMFTSAGESFTETDNGSNNAIAAANSISVGTTYKGQIAKNDDKDFYKFTINSSGKYTLSSNAAITWLDYRIYDSMGDRIWNNGYAANSAGNITVNETLELSNGVYYLGVERNSGYTGNYSFRIAPHSHRYTSKVTRATLYQNGKINYECACGATKQTIIYYPRTISLSTAKYTYNGQTRTPNVSVKGSDGKVIGSSNYTVSYASGRKNVGTYQVKITFKGNYSGTVSKTFKINPKSTSITSLTAKSKGFKVKWKKQTTQVSGYQIQYSTSKYFSNGTTKTITKNSTTSETLKGLKAKKKYYVRIRTYKKVSGTKYYSSWSSAKTVKTNK